MSFKNLFFLLISFFLVAFGQPAWIPVLGPFASCIGFAFFWHFLDKVLPKQSGFWWSTLWFAFVQMVQLSWMTSIQFQGLYILFVYAGLCFILGVQFGFLTRFLRRRTSLTMISLLGCASLWTLLEWSRLFFFCGFSFNFSGMALSGFVPSMQLAAVFGILGLSFWVIFTNGLALKALREKFSLKNCLIWSAIALFPYAFGFSHLAYVNKKESTSNGLLHVALLQPGMLPSQKVPLKKYLTEFISPYEQWRQVYQYLQTCQGNPIDVIVLPEAVVPFGQNLMIYSLDGVRKILMEEDLSESVVLPPLEFPYAEQKQGRWYVSNSFWAQLIANAFSADVVTGLDAQDPITKESFNAAFHFKPLQSSSSIERYEKRLLLPLAETLPWNFLKIFTKAYGITEFFTPGDGPKIFALKQRAGVSICYEDTFPGLMQETRAKGADFFINLTNDGWYPFSRLPMQHFTHSRLRTVENGIPLLRACNTGITAIVDSNGVLLSRLGSDTNASQVQPGILYDSFPSHQHKTLFSLWGNAGIVSISLLLFALSLRRKDRHSIF